MMFNKQAVKAIFFVGLIAASSSFSNNLPCMFVYEDLCLNVQLNPDHFESISVKRSRAVGEVNLYFWNKSAPETFLNKEALKGLGYNRISVLMDMSHMLSSVHVASVPVCNITRALKKGYWIEDNDNSAFQIISSVQAGVYYIQVNLFIDESSFISMQRDNEAGKSMELFERYLEQYDHGSEVDLRLLPTDSTYYFGVHPEDNEVNSVKLYLKP